MGMSAAAASADAVAIFAGAAEDLQALLQNLGQGGRGQSAGHRAGARP